MQTSSTKYPNSNAIMDYIGAQAFLKPSDIAGLNSLEDLVNMINAILNTKNLYLFVAQCGVRASDVITVDGILYDIVDTNVSESSAAAITLVWKESNSSGYSA